MNIFGIGLPEIGRSLAKTIRSFQQASSEFQNEFKKEVQQLEETIKTTAEIEPKQIESSKEQKHS